MRIPQAVGSFPQNIPGFPVATPQPDGVQSPEPMTSAPTTADGGLNLPLVDDQDSEVWTEPPTDRSGRTVWPGLLWSALREAVDATPGDPERALMVVESFCRTMATGAEAGAGEGAATEPRQ